MVSMIQLKNIKKTYNRGKENAFEALHDVSLEISDNEMIAIVGTSGAGKSTLLHILSLIDCWDEGEYWMNDVLVNDLNETKQAEMRSHEIGVVLQDYALVEDFTGINNVLLPLDFDKAKKRTKKEKLTLANQALEQVGMREFSSKKCNQLSGGQKQRIAIARAIVNNPYMIIADEPTGALDTENAKQIMEILKRLQGNGRIVIIVTHDMNIAQYADRVIRIEDGNIVND